MLNLDSILNECLIPGGYEVKVSGNTSVQVETFVTLNEVCNGRITWVKNWSDEVFEKLEQCQDLIVVCSCEKEMSSSKNCYLSVSNPKAAFFETLGCFFEKKPSRNIDSTAIVKTDRVGQDVSIGEYCVISEDTVIGNHVTLGSHVRTIGRVAIGDYALIQSGTVIGEASFGYYKGNDGHLHRVPPLGGVVIGEHVEIGANSTIDRGTMADTIIGAHAKIGNLVHIAHNVTIGEDSALVSTILVCGSTKVGEDCYIAPGSVIMNQKEIGDHATVGMGAIVLDSVEEGSIVVGVPAKPIKK